MKRRIYALAAVLVLALSITANAALRAPVPALTLSFSGTTAQCSFTINAPGKEIKATATLFHIDGKDYIAVGYWPNLSADGSLRFAKTCTAQKGEKYELRVESTVDGVKLPAASVIKTC